MCYPVRHYPVGTYHHSDKLVIILDTEANGLMGASLLPNVQQPRLLEFAAVKGHFPGTMTFVETDRVEFFCNPGMPIDPKVQKITGITDEMIRKAKPFAAHYLSLVRFFLGEDTLVAHNAPYDTLVLRSELVRIDKEIQFPWPFKHICTVEQTQHINQKYTKLADLYEGLTGKPANQRHRAMDDVKLLVEVVKHLHRDGVL